MNVLRAESGGEADKVSVVTRQLGNWYGLWAAGYYRTATTMRSRCRTSAHDDDPIVPNRLLHKHRLLRPDLALIGDTELFDRYTCMLADAIYGRNGDRPVDLVIARTMPECEDWEQVRAYLAGYFRRPGGPSSYPIRQYGELMCCCHSDVTPTVENASDWLLAYIGVTLLSAADAVDSSKWDLFYNTRQRALDGSLALVDRSEPVQADQIEGIIYGSALSPGNLEWHVSCHSIRPSLQL